MQKDMEYEEFQVKVIHQTRGAVLVKIDGETEERWIPWSQVEDNGEEFETGYSGPMYLSKWICEKSGI